MKRRSRTTDAHRRRNRCTDQPRVIDAKIVAAEEVARRSPLEQKQLVFLRQAPDRPLRLHELATRSTAPETISNPGTNLSDWGQKQVQQSWISTVISEPEKIEEHEVKDVMDRPDGQRA